LLIAAYINADIYYLFYIFAYSSIISFVINEFAENFAKYYNTVVPDLESFFFSNGNNTFITYNNLY